MNLSKVKVEVSLTRRVQPKKFAPFEITVCLAEEWEMFGDECLVDPNFPALHRKLEEEASDILAGAIVRQVQKFYGPDGLVRINSKED